MSYLEKSEKIEKSEKSGTNQSKIFDLKFLKKILKNENLVKTLIFGGFALLILVIMADTLSGLSGLKVRENENQAEDKAVYEEHEKRLEQKLEKAISAIDGVGELTIVVTLDSLSETVYSERGSGVKTTITPKVRGVAVICDGGGDPVVKQKIVELVSRVLGISTTKISVTN